MIQDSQVFHFEKLLVRKLFQRLLSYSRSRTGIYWELNIYETIPKRLSVFLLDIFTMLLQLEDRVYHVNSVARNRFQ